MCVLDFRNQRLLDAKPVRYLMHFAVNEGETVIIECCDNMQNAVVGCAIVTSKADVEDRFIVPFRSRDTSANIVRVRTRTCGGA
jgi:hypothetical protein